MSWQIRYHKSQLQLNFYDIHFCEFAFPEKICTFHFWKSETFETMLTFSGFELKLHSFLYRVKSSRARVWLTLGPTVVWLWQITIFGKQMKNGNVLTSVTDMKTTNSVERTSSYTKVYSNFEKQRFPYCVHFNYTSQ